MQSIYYSAALLLTAVGATLGKQGHSSYAEGKRMPVISLGKPSEYFFSWLCGLASCYLPIS